MGPSMLPTFNTRGDVLILEHFTTYLRRIDVGESELLPSLKYCHSQYPCQSKHATRKFIPERLSVVVKSATCHQPHERSVFEMIVKIQRESCCLTSLHHAAAQPLLSGLLHT